MPDELRLTVPIDKKLFSDATHAHTQPPRGARGYRRTGARRRLLLRARPTGDRGLAVPVIRRDRYASRMRGGRNNDAGRRGRVLARGTPYLGSARKGSAGEVGLSLPPRP